MDDNYRLIKLISLVAWTESDENTCGLRCPTETERSRLTEAEQTAGHSMCAFYDGAVQHYLGSTGHSDTVDTEQLPVITLDFVTALSEDAVEFLGELVGTALNVDRPADPKATARTLGQTWVQDVTATCWRLALANREDHFFKNR